MLRVLGVRGEARSKVKAEFQGVTAWLERMVCAGCRGGPQDCGWAPPQVDIPAAPRGKAKPGWAVWCHCRAETRGPGTSHLRTSSLGPELSVSSGSPLLLPNRCCLPRASTGRGPSSIPIYPMMSPIPVHPDISSDVTSPSPPPWCGSGAGEDTRRQPYPAPQRTSRSQSPWHLGGVGRPGAAAAQPPQNASCQPHKPPLPLVPTARTVLRAARRARSAALEEPRCPRTGARCAPR